MEKNKKHPYCKNQKEKKRKRSEMVASPVSLNGNSKDSLLEQDSLLREEEMIDSEKIENDQNFNTFKYWDREESEEPKALPDED